MGLAVPTQPYQALHRLKFNRLLHHRIAPDRVHRSCVKLGIRRLFVPRDKLALDEDVPKLAAEIDHAPNGPKRAVAHAESLTGKIKSGDSFRGEPTALPTGYASINSASNGTSSDCSSAFLASGDVHHSAAALVRMTGMRSCSDAMSLFGVVVTMVNVSSFSTGQNSHSPAKTNGSSVFKWMKCGTFSPSRF